MSNLLDKASIILTPTAYNNGEALCVKPSDGSGDFDFSRNSAATRVNAQGLVENVQILSSNLVQNGDFSEQGSEEVSNGSFSQEGAEQISNGSFDTDTKWTTNTGWSISGGSANCDGTQSGNATLVQQNGVKGAIIDFVVGKTYKVNFDVVVTSGNITNIEVASGYDGDNVTTSGNHTAYITAVSTNDRFTITANPDFIGSIDNVSVREVGQDWSFTNWSLTTGNVLLADTGGYVYQSNVFEVGKSYKVSVNVKDYTSGNLRIDSNGANNWTPSGSNSVATIYISNLDKTYLLLEGTFRGSITNISVKEVGQNWNFDANWSIGNNKATSTGGGRMFQSIPFLEANVGTKVKVSFDIVDYTSAGVVINCYGGVSSLFQGVGSYSFITTTTNTLNLYVNNSGDGGLVGSITNISVIEITDDTNLPRINYEGFSYQDALGSELVLNGTFDSNIDFWNKGGGNVNPLSWNNGKIKITNDVAQLNSARQTIVTEIGKTYKVSADVDSTNGITPRLASSNPTTAVIGTLGTIETLTYTFTATSTSSQIELFNWQNTINKYNLWDNVSVKEYLGQSVVPGSGCGSWLWEPQSTNLLPYSSDYTQWNKSGSMVITSNNAISPDGTQNASLLTANAANQYIYLSAFAAANSTISLYIKRKTGTGDIELSNNGGSSYTVLSVTDEWNRVQVTFAASTNQTVIKINTSGDEIYLWGVQLEALSYASSLIPTSGSTVTRNQDLCTNGGSLASINSTDGVLYAEINFVQTGLTNGLYAISDGTFNNYLMLRFSPTNKIQVEASGGVNLIETNVRASGNYKTAVKYSSSGVELWVDGTKIIETSTQTSISGINQIMVAKSPFGNIVGCKTKAVAVWKEALSDQELAELTYPTPTFPTFSLDFNTIAEQFTFARGSEATYVDAQGLIQSTNVLGAELITNGDFATDSDWTLGTGWTISGGTANYDGLQAYQLLRQGTANGVIGKTYIVKYDVSNNNGAGGIIAKFGGVNLSSYNSNNGSFEYYVDAISTDYIRFTPQLDFNGSIDNVSVKEVISATNTPRLDYSTGAEAFLLEPQSTNLITQSELFSDSFYVKDSGVVVGAKNNISPSGNANATKIDVTNNGRIYANIATNTYYTSVFIKSGTFSHFKFAGSNVNLIAETNANGSIQKFSNGWYRISLSYTGNRPFQIQAYPDGTYSSHTTSGNYYIWGAQAETLPFVSSLIPTSGSQVTRNQETCINATPEINSEEGVLYFEGSSLSDGFGGAISLSDGTSSNYIYLYYHPSGTKIVAKIVVNSITVYDKNITTLDEVNYNKIAFKYQDSSFKIFANGVNISSLNQNSGNTFPINILNKLSFDNGAGSTPFFGNTKDLQVYTKALSDAELIKLTTI